MAIHACINGTLINTKSSAPVPVIGLYIAAASLVCMLSMIYDILVGLYTRKVWLPCKIFKLDSITLTLVSVAVKLTVDLTTTMPTVLDQLSKLCGTTFLCTYMFFIMPSVGVMNDSTNIYSLSILVITVFVNMCIQISTGVVVLFIPEHIIILCIMIILLGHLWYLAGILKWVRRYNRKANKKFFRSGETVLHRLKACYLYGYSCNSQFIACMEPASDSTGWLNLICIAILIQAAYRSVIVKSVKLCRRNSDYDWSVPIIVVNQVLTVIIGSSVSLSRLFTIMSRIAYSAARKIGSYSFNIDEEPYERNPIFVDRQFSHKIWLFIIAFIYTVIMIITFPIFCLAGCLAVCLTAMMKNFKSGYNEVKEDFQYLIKEGRGIDEWILGKGLTEMEKEIEASKSEPNELFQLLSKVSPSQQSQVEHISDRVGSDGESIPVSTLSVVLLVRIAQISLPKDLNSILVKTFGEAYKFLCFIEENLFVRSPEFAKKLEVAKAMWLDKDFSHLVVKTFDECTTGQSQFDTNCALAIIAEVKSKMPEDMIYSELTIIENYINRRQYSSIKELYDCIEQLYIDMLHVILAQFPTAAIIALTENDPGDDDHIKRARLALKFVCKFELVEDRIHWKFPQGSNLSGFIKASDSAREEGTVAVNNQDVHPSAQDNVPVPVPGMMMHDEIIEVGDANVARVS